MIGIIGAICGDIIGSAYEFVKEPFEYDFELLHDGCYTTDDTTHTIAVADWLMHTDRSSKALVEKLRYWSVKYPRGFGPMFVQWLISESTEPYGSLGNGSGMRVSPVAWVAQSLDECIDLAQRSAQVTHNHPEGIKGAISIAVAIFLTRQGKSKEEIIKYIEQETGWHIPDYVDKKNNHVFNCTCPYSIISALSCWKDSTSYEDCIRKAVSLNGDCDTEACMAGSICNANPETQISDELILNIVHKGIISNEMIDIINEFHDKYEHTLNQSL